MFNNIRKVYITGLGGSLGNELFNVFKLNDIIVNGHYHKLKNSSERYSTFGDITNEKVRNNVVEHFILSNSNVFINNAGVYINKPILDMSEEEIINLINLNLTSSIILTQKILNHLVNNGGGMIYNINSVAGIHSSINESVYCASKFGLKGFTDSLIQEYKNNKDIRIVNVTLGAFKSKMTKHRTNYTELSDPNEIANKIFTHIMEDYKTINTDLSIYRK